MCLECIVCWELALRSILAVSKVLLERENFSQLVVCSRFRRYAEAAPFAVETVHVGVFQRILWLSKGIFCLEYW